MQYRVYITDFQRGTHSTHRTLEAARKSEAKLQRDIRKGNGSSSYLPTRIECRENDGQWEPVE